MKSKVETTYPNGYSCPIMINGMWFNLYVETDGNVNSRNVHKRAIRCLKKEFAKNGKKS